MFFKISVTLTRKYKNVHFTRWRIMSLKRFWNQEIMYFHSTDILFFIVIPSSFIYSWKKIQAKRNTGTIYADVLSKLTHARSRLFFER